MGGMGVMKIVRPHKVMCALHISEISGSYGKKKTRLDENAYITNFFFYKG